MKKLLFEKENLESLNHIDFKKLDMDLLIEIINLLNKINFKNIDGDGSYIEIKNDVNDEYVSFNLNSKDCIPIEITLYQNYIDFTVCITQTIYQMYKIDKTKINEESKFLNKWVNHEIVNLVKYSDDLIIYSKFFDKFNTANIIYKSSSFFHFLTAGNIKETEYKAWNA